ncbi:MAG: peptide chain release factor N(5)-glutamine methyltransferase [Blastochloris sp.]|nr:peptide chain release factor N(5)-glutamine methyltransferase [Blastochloris sp.]
MQRQCRGSGPHRSRPSHHVRGAQGSRPRRPPWIGLQPSLAPTKAQPACSAASAFTLESQPLAPKTPLRDFVGCSESQRGFFQKKGLDSPRLQIELLLAHVLQLPRMQLYLQFERVLTEAELETLRPLVKRRAEREPLQYIVGKTSFMGLELLCAPGALIPRPETELFVDMIKKELAPLPPGTLADVGSGTGAIALSLAAALPSWTVWGIEPEPDAAALFQKNHERHPQLTNLQWASGPYLSGTPADLSVVVANLPYLTSAEMDNLQAELRFEPATALAGGADGLDLIRELIRQIPATVQRVYLELGLNQAPEVSALLQSAGFPQVSTQQDLLGRDRFVFASR